MEKETKLDCALHFFLLIFCSSKEKEGKGRGKGKLEEKKSRYGTLPFVC